MDTPEKVEKIESHERDLMVKLTPEERQARGLALANAYEELSSHKADEANTKAALKAKEAEIAARIQAIAICIRQGQERRRVACYGVADWKNGRVIFYRGDTDEAIGADRAISAEERQHKLAIEEPQTEAEVLNLFNPVLVEGGLPAEEGSGEGGGDEGGGGE